MPKENQIGELGIEAVPIKIPVEQGSAEAGDIHPGREPARLMWQLILDDFVIFEIQ